MKPESITRHLSGLSGLTYAEFPCTPGRLALPDVACDLIWTGSELLFVGPMSKGRLVERAFRRMAVLTIGTPAAMKLAGMPLSELTDVTLPLADLAPHVASPLTDLFGDGDGARLVAPSAATPPEPHGLVLAARALARGAGPGNVAEALGITARHFRRQFNTRFGLSPERFVQILRLRRAIRLFRDGHSLAIASAMAGYSDQPHLNRQCRVLTGLSPGEALSRLGGSDEVIARAADENVAVA